MAEFALALVVAFLLLERAWSGRESAREKRRLLNTIVARNPAELAVLNRVDEAPKAKPVVEREPVPVQFGI